MAKTTVYTDGMVMFKRQANVTVDGMLRGVCDFTISNGVAKARVSGKCVETKCMEGEYVYDIERRLIRKANNTVLSNKDRSTAGMWINGHHITKCRTKNNYDGTVTVTGYVDDEFTEIRYKAASLDEQGKLHHGKPWLRTAREGLVEEYERNHKTTSIVTYAAEKKANVVLAMCDEAFRDDLVAKGVERNGTQYAYLGRPIKVGDNVTQFSVMNQMKEINAEVNDEVKAFFDDLRIS